MYLLIRLTIYGMLGLLLLDQFHVLIEVLWEPLSRLLVSSMMMCTHYKMQSIIFASIKASTYLKVILWPGKRKKLLTLTIHRIWMMAITMSQNWPRVRKIHLKWKLFLKEGLHDLDIPEGLGELSLEAQDYIRDLQSQLPQFSNELQESQLKNTALQMQNLVVEEKNDLLNYVRYLETEIVVELSEPTSSEVQEVIQCVIHGIVATLSPKMNLKALPHFENGTVNVRRSWDEDSVEIIENAALQLQLMPQRSISGRVYNFFYKMKNS